ncbi:hypothetical protein [Paraburkholderia hospita]|uniref:hypothetical protein n=1 Tax=Paraburkholderia hospita TaxID=169430 RepID=UPI001F60C123|nr:hypothetical protein [Paraburkholderia hospita]
MRHSVARLLAMVLVLSCAITLVVTAVRRDRDYERGIALIQNRLVDIDGSYRDSRGEALCRLDQPQLKLKPQLEEMLRLANIHAAEVRESQSASMPMVVAVGDDAGANASITKAVDFDVLLARMSGLHGISAARLHQLARAWQSKPVLQLVELYLEGNTAS